MHCIYIRRLSLGDDCVDGYELNPNGKPQNSKSIQPCT